MLCFRTVLYIYLLLHNGMAPIKQLFKLHFLQNTLLMQVYISAGDYEDRHDEDNSGYSYFSERA